MGSSVTVLILTAAVIYTPGCFRIVRAVAVGINATDFVTAARARGERNLTVVVEEILPNMVTADPDRFRAALRLHRPAAEQPEFPGNGHSAALFRLGRLVRENMDGLGHGAPAVIIPGGCDRDILTVPSTC